MSSITLSSPALQAKYGSLLEEHLLQNMTVKELCSEMGPCLRLFKILYHRHSYEPKKVWSLFSKEDLLKAFPPSLDTMVALSTIGYVRECISLLGEETIASLCLPTYDVLRALKTTDGDFSSFFNTIPLPSTQEEVSLLVTCRLELLLLKLYPLHEIQEALDAIGDITSPEEIQALYRKERKEGSLRFYYGEGNERSMCYGCNPKNCKCWYEDGDFYSSSEDLVDFFPQDLLGGESHYDYDIPRKYLSMDALPLLTQCWRVAMAFSP